MSRSANSVFAAAVLRAAIALALLLQTPAPAFAASVLVAIDLSQQVMNVSVAGDRKFRWRVSTGKPGCRTPTGTFKPQRLERVWYSTKYDNAPMPHSIFFYRDYAIHGTADVKHLGRPASHGCVRLHPANARTLFNLVLRNGRRNTTIVIRK